MAVSRVAYPARFTVEAGGSVAVCFRDLPEALTSGDNLTPPPLSIAWRGEPPAVMSAVKPLPRNQRPLVGSHPSPQRGEGPGVRYIPESRTPHR